MVTFGINKGNWESLARAELSRHLSKTVKRRSPAACVVRWRPPRARREAAAWISLPKLQDAGFSECRQQTHIHLSEAVNQCFNRSCQTFIYLFTYLFCQRCFFFCFFSVQGSDDWQKQFFFFLFQKMKRRRRRRAEHTDEDEELLLSVSVELTDLQTAPFMSHF